MKLKHLLLGSVLFPMYLSAQLSSPGDIAFTGFNADGDDDLAFVTFKDIPANTEIYFCDSEWDGSGFGSDEGDFTWNSGATVIPKGTIITLNTISSGITVNHGSITTNNAGGLGNSDEAMFAFLGTAPRTVTTMLAAVANDTSGFGTLDGSGLILGQSAILLTSSTDVAQYNGPRTGLNQSEYLVELNDLDNWQQEEGSGDQHENGTAPDLPFDLAAFEVEEGGGQTATIAFDSAYMFANENDENATIQIAISNESDTEITADVVLVTNGGNASNGSEFNFTSQSVTFPANSTEAVSVNIPLIDNSEAGIDRFFVLELTNVQGGSISGTSQKVIYIKDNEIINPEANNALDMEFLTSYLVDDDGTAEIVAFDEETQRLFVLNSTSTKINIVDFSNPAEITEITEVDMTSYGEGATSVAVKNGLVAATVVGVDFADGKVVFMDVNGENVSSVTVGNLPDMVTFTHDGTKVLTANEGQPNSDYTIDPDGSISVIDVTGGLGNISQSDVTTLNFHAFDSQINDLKAAGVRIFGPGATVSQDLEPEYITISDDNTKAWVTLQENNAIGVIDLVEMNITDILPLGYKDHSIARNSLDTSDQLSDIFFSTWPIKGVYMPDAMANYTVNGVTYLVTANEGDAREYDAYEEELKVGSGDYVLDEEIFPDADVLKLNNNLGRLAVTKASGDTDGDGVYEEIHVFGGRSFSIWNTESGELVYDSGDDFERITANDPVYGEFFNASNDNDEFKNRSDNKGPEPEGVTVAEINDKIYAFITLERIGGVMVYDVTDPENAVFVNYTNSRNEGDLAPEGIIYIAPGQNSLGKGLIITANEVSATLSVLVINNDVLAVNDESLQNNFKIYPNPVKDGLVYFSEPVSGEIYTMSGEKILSFKDKAYLNISSLSKGIYVIKASNGASEKIVVK